MCGGAGPEEGRDSRPRTGGSTQASPAAPDLQRVVLVLFWFRDGPLSPMRDQEDTVMLTQQVRPTAEPASGQAAWSWGTPFWCRLPLAHLFPCHM